MPAPFRLILQLAARRSSSAGTALIEHALPDARIRREFEPTGLVCMIEMPLPQPHEGL